MVTNKNMIKKILYKKLDFLAVYILVRNCLYMILLFAAISPTLPFLDLRNFVRSLLTLYIYMKLCILIWIIIEAQFQIVKAW
jgi:hypothetical protein